MSLIGTSEVLLKVFRRFKVKVEIFKKLYLVLVTEVLPEILFWCFFILVTLSEIMKHRRGSTGGYKICLNNGDNSVDHSNVELIIGNNGNGGDYSDGDDGTTPINKSEQRGQPTFGRRGDKNNLHEMRKHRRLMKMKYDENRDNLLYYCFYKGITDKYYNTLRQC